MQTRAKTWEKELVVRKQMKKYGHEVWSIFSKLATIPGNPETLRRDSKGVVIDFNHYGLSNINTGWHVDHDKPQSLFPELTFVLSNLNALNWRSNIQKGNKFDHLDKTNHYALMETNLYLKRRRPRDTKLQEGQMYNIHLSPRVKEPRLGRVLEIKKSTVRIKCDGTEQFVYRDSRLFQYTHNDG